MNTTTPPARFVVHLIIDRAMLIWEIALSSYERLVNITGLGITFQVPEKNTCLRVFQYMSPETIPYGRFCWNQECQLCRISYSYRNERR